MKKDVTITLISTQTDGVDTDKSELITEGVYEKSADGYVLSYVETEATGYDGSTTVLEVVGNDKVVMTRKGEASSNLVIETGRKHHCHYGTPYGDFMVGINTREIVNEVSEETGGDLMFRYVIDVNSSYVGDFEISVNVRMLQ